MIDNRKEFITTRVWDDAMIEITSDVFKQAKAEVEIELNTVYQEIPYYAGVWVLRAYQSTASGSTVAKRKRSATTSFQTEIWVNNDTTITADTIDSYEVPDNKTTLQDLDISALNTTVSECLIEEQKSKITPPPYLTMLLDPEVTSLPVGIPIYYECTAQNEVLDSSVNYIDPDGDSKFTIMCGEDGQFDKPEWPTRENCIAPNLCVEAPIPPVESKLSFPIGSIEATNEDGDSILQTKIKVYIFLITKKEIL